MDDLPKIDENPVRDDLLMLTKNHGINEVTRVKAKSRYILATQVEGEFCFKPATQDEGESSYKRATQFKGERYPV